MIMVITTPVGQFNTIDEVGLGSMQMKDAGYY
jgi:hypothetical protein